MRNPTILGKKKNHIFAHTFRRHIDVKLIKLHEANIFSLIRNMTAKITRYRPLESKNRL